MNRAFSSDYSQSSNLALDYYNGESGSHRSSHDFDGSSSALLGLTVALFKYRRRILIVMALTIVLALAAALTLNVSYVARGVVLATMSADYTVRPDAGAAGISSGALEQDQIVRTERDILANDELHRAVLRAVGPTVIYPELGEKPTGFGAFIAELKSIPTQIRQMITGQAPAKQPPNLVEAALVPFDASFSTEATKDSNAISVMFTHRDPAMAAHVLNVLMSTYLTMRRDLYSSPQSAIVENRVNLLRQQYDAADQALNQYKAEKHIADFHERQTVLERNKGQAEDKLAEVTGQIAQDNARITSLTVQLQRIPATIVGRRDLSADTHADPERRSVNTLQEALSKLESTYQPNSPVVLRLREQLRMRQSDLHRLESDGKASSVQYEENPLWAKANLDLLQATNDLKAGQAYYQKLVDYLAQINQQLQSTTMLDAQLAKLEQQRTIAQDAYSSGVKELEQRRLIDMVEARKETSVRILEPAAVPIRPNSVRRLVFMAGIFLSLILGGLIALLSNYFRAYYLTPDELERDLGLPVLASVRSRGTADLPRLINPA